MNFKAPYILLSALLMTVPLFPAMAAEPSKAALDGSAKRMHKKPHVNLNKKLRRKRNEDRVVEF